MNNLRLYLFYIAALPVISFFLSFACLAQNQVKSSLKHDINATDSMRYRLPVEKIYLQSDKANYVQNDTLWFKAYILNADFLTPSTRSGLFYVELDDAQNKCAKRLMFTVALMGLGWGNIALDEDELAEGRYTLRAYTNWMQNFGEDYVFKKQIYISSAKPAHLISSDFKQSRQGDKMNIEAGLLFSNLAGDPVRLQDMQLKVTDGKHNLLKADVATGVDGKLAVNFNLPDNTDTKNLSILVQDKIKKPTEPPISYTIPVVLDQPANTDLQFMPEGGTLIAGVSTKIAFKAIGEDGKGLDVAGKIYNGKGEEVALFKSIHQGMGSFIITPRAAEVYTAKLTSPDGDSKIYPLPAVSAWGVSLSVLEDSPADDSLQVSMVNKAAVPGIVAPGDLYLIAQARGVVCYAARFKPGSISSSARVAKANFPTGIARFTVLNNANQPVAERIVYVDHHDHLHISISPDKEFYAPHDSIALRIKVTDQAGKPIRGSFAMAVTDDNQVKIDSLGSNIANYLLLGSDLKGTIEDPAYYFENGSAKHTEELDDLLLSQGWVAYNWQQVFAPATKPLYAAEPEFAVSGKVTNVFNKPVVNTRVTLLSKKPFFVVDTITDKNGRFIFDGFLPVDTASFLVEARNKRGKSFNVGIEMDEFKPPVFTSPIARVSPWYVNSDTLLLHTLNNKLTKQLDDARLQGLGRVLKEVKIKDRKIVKNSKNLNGPGLADQIFDEQDMLKAGKMTLGDYLAKKVPGFHEGYLRKSTVLNYKIFDEPANIVIDGVFTDRFYTPNGSDINAHYQFIKQYLDYYTAEDITGIEVMYNPGYSNNYIVSFLSPTLIGEPIAFIEITTRAGHGPFMEHTPGTYLYKPLAVSLPKLFYRPKYTVKDSRRGVDLRSTIHWEPNIITDTAGKASVSFYSADKPSIYTIVLEGADLNGSAGFIRKKINVH